jgi:alpha-mannosidase
MRIVQAHATPLFTGTATRPHQIVRVTVAGKDGGGSAERRGRGKQSPSTAAPVLVRVEGPGVTTRQPFRIENLPPGAERVAEVPVTVAAPHGPGSRLGVTVIAEGMAARAEQAAEITVAEPGWTIWMVCHFHYDPVWWNTQGEFTQTQVPVPGENGQLPDTRSAFELVRLHLAAARDDPDYKFVLAEVDYLKPYFDVHPEDRAELRELIAAGRVEIVGGAYNEPNTNLTSAESTIRNIVYGLGHQRDVLGADPSIAWALDAFGHDPGYPGLMAAAGMTGSAWARGPYHQWGPRGTVGDNTRMQFPAEFEWISPDGRGLPTSYMANHYGAGWVIHQAADPAAAQIAALDQLALLAPVAATRNVLLPVGADHVIPARWATAVHRDFAARYVWPRCVTSLPREFFAAVRAEAAERGTWLTPQTRDMNPVYPGKDVSYIDTKQAQRAAEVAVSDGERLATLAWLAGAEYPAESLDKAWRQLVFGAHHDAITGTESDQVYLDLLGGWREAFERGEAARRAAAGFLAGQVKTIVQNGAAGAGQDPRGRPVVVFNTLSWPRADMATITLAYPEPGTPWLALSDETGAPVPFLAEGIRRHPGGSLASVTVTFRADVPALGYRTYWINAAPSAGDAGWAGVPGTIAANGAFEVTADPGRGGALTRVLDRRTGSELLRGLGNELALTEEYAAHPRWGEGPWLLSPKEPGPVSGAGSARVRAQRCPVGSRLVAEFGMGGLRITQETTLWDGIGRVEFRTHVDGSIGQDRLLRARFPARVPGGLPVFQCATAVVGRPFGVADMDVAEDWFTLDNPACEWFGLGSTARVRADGATWAIGVAEVIVPAARPDGGQTEDWRAAVRDLVAALARVGVTATCTRADGPRYGALDLDSNLPDVRIAVGGPGLNSWTAGLLGSLDPSLAAGLTARLSGPGGSTVWVPAARPRADVFTAGADVRAPRDLPVLIVSGDDVAAAVAALTEDLGDAVIEAGLAAAGSAGGRPGEAAGQPLDRLLAGQSVALLNRGTPSSLVTPDGTLHIALMRASSAWPSGVWIDGPRRTAPDGSSFAWQHWSHTFCYALAAGAGDWRDAGFVAAGQEYNHELIAVEAGQHDGPLPATGSLGEVATPGGGRPAALLSALKPRGNPLASGRPGRPRREAGVTVRLRDAGVPLPAGPGSGPAAAEVSLLGGITTARLTGLTEDGDGPRLDVAAGRALVPVPAGGPVTVAVSTPTAPATPAPAPGTTAPDPGTTAPAPAAPAPAPGTPAPAPAAPAPAPGTPAPAPAAPAPTTDISLVSFAQTGISRTPEHTFPVKSQRGAAGLTLEAEAVQPVFTRYWLHGKGPAPAGNLPVTVHLSPDRISLGVPGPPGTPAPSGPAAPGSLCVTVACGPVPADGEVTLDVPPGLAVTCPDGTPHGPLRYGLPARGHTRWDLSVRALPGTPPGRYFLAAQTGDDLGQVLEDTALITIGEQSGPAPGLPRAELLAALEAGRETQAAEVGVDLAPATLELAPGECAALTVRLANRTASVIRGESQLVSPFGSWCGTRGWTRGFTAGPGETVVLDYPVTLPPAARPGAHWWALAKVMYFGRVHYTECAEIRVTGSPSWP